MRILGIDPGLAIIGYGVIDSDRGKHTVVDVGVIQTPKTENVPARLHMIYDAMLTLLDKYRPDHIALEELFFTKNITTGINVAQARGVILLACGDRCGRLYEYTPMQIKQAITGYGRADKHQIQAMVTRLLRLKAIPRPDDAADALAVAMTHAQTARLGGLFSI